MTPFVLLPALAHAEDAASAPLHVVRRILHAEQDKAELCLEFNQSLNDIGNSARIASSLRLESDGNKISVPTRNISVGGDQLCISALDHRKDYKLNVAALRNAKGEKISQAESLTFTVPPRHAALTFSALQSRNGIVTGHENPILRSINNEQVLVELYRITDPAHMAEAWNQRMQTTLAPSESLYFARHNGSLSWKKDLTPGGQQDKVAESKVDFDSQGELTPGLYLLAASDADAKPIKQKAKEDAEKDNALTPTAALWLLRSDLSIHALREGKSFRVMADTNDGSAVAANVRLLALDRDQQILAETRSDAHGMAILTPKQDKGDVQTIVALSDKGDATFLDVAQDMMPSPALPSMTATITTEQSVYMPADTIIATLNVRDLHKRPVTLKDSVVQLLRPNNSVYDSQPVTLDASGNAKLVFTAPVPSGVWHLVWRRGDNKLAESHFRISANISAPVLSITADRAAFTSDGGANLTIRSLAANNTAAPFVAGHVELTWIKPDHPFAGWRDYIFDNGQTVDPDAKTLGSFLTNANGQAHLHVNLPPSSGAPALRQVQLRVISDDTLDALDPEPLIMPVRPADVVLGVKPRNGKRHFPENSIAHFDVVALDADGQRHSIDDLTYQIFEEGRNFEWYQAEGRWEYRLLQERRRRGGGTLSFDANNMAAIEWPVTSGAYQLDISNGEGKLLSRINFNAGWGLTATEKDEPAPLPLKASLPSLQTNKEEKISFTLPRAALVTATVADDTIRSVIHAAYPAGANSISFTPTADWGNRVVVKVETRDMAGQILLSTTNDTAPTVNHTIIKPAAPPKLYSLIDSNLALQEIAHQTLAAQKTWDSSSAKLRNPAVAMLAPQPIGEAPTLLSATLQLQPLSTRELAYKLRVIRLWHDALVASNLLSESDWRALQNNLVMRLLARQNSDGGFKSVPDEISSETQSTAAAIETLVTQNDALSRPAIEQASLWLRHQLENTWFEEKDRAPRASAYAALAASGKLDLASLHYYSDTSADKPLPALAMAQLAFAFASINDKPASNYWTGKIDKAAIDSEVLPVLLANPFFAPNTAQAALSESAKQATAKTDDLQTISSHLIALWRSVDRAGDWRIGINRDEKNMHGVYVMPVSDKTIVSLRNPSSDRALDLTLLGTTKKSFVKNNGQRHIYDLEGNDANNNLEAGSLYVVTAEGTWPTEAGEKIAIHDNPQPVMQPVTCALNAPESDHMLGWMSGKPPNPVTTCEKTANGLDALITRSGDANQWRIAYLAKAIATDMRGLRPLSIKAMPVSNPDDKDDRH